MVMALLGVGEHRWKGVPNDTQIESKEILLLIEVLRIMREAPMVLDRVRVCLAAFWTAKKVDLYCF
jgi:hypothetical protein